MKVSHHSGVKCFEYYNPKGLELATAVRKNMNNVLDQFLKTLLDEMGNNRI